MEPRLRASPRHGGQGFFLNCWLLICRGGDRLRGGGNHRKWRRVKKNLVSYLNSSIFMGNAQLQAILKKGVSPQPLWLPNAITPGQVLRHHRQVLGRYGRTGIVPDVTVPVLFNHLPMADGSSQHLYTGYCCNDENDDRLVDQVNNEGMPS